MSTELKIDSKHQIDTNYNTSFIEQIATIVQHYKERPSWDEYFMGAAFLIASRSACQRLHVGCVLVSTGQHPNRILASGYNGFLPGAPHTSHVRDGHELATVHAEQNAITDAARRGAVIEGAVAYITHFPCIHCTKMLIASGVKTIKYYADYQNDPLIYTFIHENGIILEKLGV